jgi:hypothetical protein
MRQNYISTTNIGRDVLCNNAAKDIRDILLQVSRLKKTKYNKETDES